MAELVLLQAVGAVATLAAAVAAWRAAKASEKQAAIAEATRQALSKPEVIVDAVYHAEYADIRVRNIGHGAAREIKFEAAPMSLPSTMSSGYDVLQEAAMFQQGIHYLAPKDGVSTAWTGLIGLEDVWHEQVGDVGITIDATYRDDQGREYGSRSVINPLIDMVGRMDIDAGRAERDRHKAFEKALPELVRIIKAYLSANDEGR
jgi:hypothetical protein